MNKVVKIIFLWGLFFGTFSTQEARAQKLDTLKHIVDNLGNFLLYRNHDPEYIANYGDEVAVRLVLANKFNYFRVIDRVRDSSLRYRPFEDLNLGAGVSYKWFAMDITFNLGLRDLSRFENNKSFDFQTRIFSSRQYISSAIQYYQGYELNRTRGFNVPVSEAAKYREDLRIINFDLKYLYAFNYTRFSIKAPFVFNEIQKKSAGSIIGGANFSIFNLVADSSVVVQEFQPFFDPTLYIRSISILNVGVSFGYMYTLVFKQHFFLTLSVIPGVNLNSGDYFSQQRQFISPNLNLKLGTMNAIGYNGRKFFIGLNFIADTYLSRLARKMNVEVGYGKTTFFAGYRFGGQDKKKASP